LSVFGSAGANLGGALKTPIQDLDRTQAGIIINQINAINPSSYTPLAETLSDIGRYFAIGTLGANNATNWTNWLDANSANLTLHPSAATPTTDTIGKIFNLCNTAYSSEDNGINTTVNTCTANNESSTGAADGTTDGLDYTTAAIASPITNYCQKSAVILVTDGLPNKDRAISDSLRDYSGDCTAGQCDQTPSDAKLKGPSTPLTKTAPATTANSCPNNNDNSTNSGSLCQNGTKIGRSYETEGSDYLDDVAAALYEMDLRPDLRVLSTTSPKNNITTYAIGIADPIVKNQVKPSNLSTGAMCGATACTGNPVGTILEAAAEKGGGFFKFADNVDELKTALDAMIANIRKGVGSFSTIAANSTQLSIDTALFQALYDSADWTGDFFAIKLDTNGDAIFPAQWNAGEKIVKSVVQQSAQTDWQARNIFTYNTAATGTKGISLKAGGTAFATGAGAAATACGQLSATQRTALGITSCSSTTDTGLWRLDYLRGDISHEAVISTQSTYKYGSLLIDPRQTNNTATNRIFRNRVRYHQKNSAPGVTPAYSVGDVRYDPWLLGDIVNSSAAYVYNDDAGYTNSTGLTTAEKSSYSAFVTGKSAWTPMLYVGANDGFLHGFNGSLTSTGGTEVLAYMPESIFKNNLLKELSSPSYTHKYSVDGTPIVSDVYFDSAWHTVLVGTTGAGGSGIFALDVSDPATFSAADILWEVSSDRTPNTTDATTLLANLGYALPQLAIGRLNDGTWAAFVANGYASSGNKAVLYILNIKTGAIIKTFDTLVGSSTTPNGLSSPFIVDDNGNGTIDAVYAGDLLGNLWKFDISTSTPSSWKIAYGTSTPAPLFIACSDGSNCNNTRQPITSAPQVGSVGPSQSTGGDMVYVGTGKYFETSDNDLSTAKTQTFYGIWDQCPLMDTSNPNSTSPATICNTSVPSPTRRSPANTPASALIEQKILVQSGTPVLRGTTDNKTPDYPTKRGWYMDFLNPNSSPATNDGERIVSTSLLRDGRVLFSTLTPSPPTTVDADICTTNTNSTSFVMILDALTGSRPTQAALSGSSVTIDGQTVPASGIGLEGAMGTPKIIDTGPSTGQITGSNSKGGIENKDYSFTPASVTGKGRQSWKQVQ
jgi:type IV pilus assembly protein PilY1